MKDFGKGDKGETNIIGKKIKKAECLTEVLGNLDELNSIIGICRSIIKEKDILEILKNVQSKIFEISSIIAGSEKYKITENDVKEIENLIKRIDESLSKISHFVYPVGYEASFLHLARAVCRRAERSLFELAEKQNVDENILKYINRLSDLLFVISRWIKKLKNEEEEIWK
ncbi:MAG: cob(I)yrinic acid a,c-diamide adenosyltransferase [Candidatus Aenigmatarchaeota archaeon]